MKTKENTRKACDNCKYFVMHYQKVSYTFFNVDRCGECRLGKFSEEEKAKLPYGFVCDKWTPKVGVDTDIYEIKEELKDITAKLILIVKALSK
ncbi:MAG: hypothetical protein K2K38_02685 [Clostridia bacterium]|nr:hypothetical protein [Clostridia bacterium]